jgi:hypothetical protein
MVYDVMWLHVLINRLYFLSIGQKMFTREIGREV